MTHPRHSSQPVATARGERAALVGLITGPIRRTDAERSLDELAGLATTAGADVVLRVLQERDRPDAATFLGSGKLSLLAAACDEAQVDLVVFDNELSPGQLRQIEKRLELKVIDRTQLILDIFAARARTREGKLQVELAQLKYLMPRLVGASDYLSRLGGGIGTRGPGETKLEADRRKIRQRLSHLGREIEDVRQRRLQLRERRHKASIPTVALVGYTNAGKTTLFNLLAGEQAVASDALFVTLDPLVRRVRLPDRRELLISDTVGFIDRLPTTLVAAFRATLEEVVAADLLLHVIDAASPGREKRMAAVRRTLEAVGAAEVPTLEVFNQCDRLEFAEQERLQRNEPDAICISALTGMGRTELLDAVTARVALDVQRVTLRLDPEREADRARLAEVYRFGRVVQHVEQQGRIVLEADVPRRLASRLQGSSAQGQDDAEPNAPRTRKRRHDA